ncbi:Lipid-A-disaccharide synthase [invertebrate metagenome]|uniref:lipid-A-disaccharide synthase n=1 Tax=invertebrate metagenome TaxID=1711999 RepID=A0A2H9T7E0_9ZZZZ
MVSSVKNASALKIALVAGEASGDMLGAGLIREIRHHCPDVQCYGIGGPLMKAEGFDSLFPMERLSVMGLVEVLGRLRELMSIRKTLVTQLLQDKPDVFIGIDAPDFNLSIEKKLKASGIPVVHYVSPQVWAWREKRLEKIRHAVDHMLVLLPFEERYYRQHGIPVTFVGHPLADQVPMVLDREAARKTLGLNDRNTIIALLPGSRRNEVAHLGALFLETAKLLATQQSDLCFLIPCANAERKAQLEPLLKQYPELSVMLYEGKAQLVMTASDVIVLASGTATLEAALHKRPLVVSYRMNPLTFAIARRVVKVKYVALPNLLADDLLVPELLQDEATAENLCKATQKALDDRGYQQKLEIAFTELHHRLKRNASELACQVIFSVIGKASVGKKA